jgi:hypothetical protein
LKALQTNCGAQMGIQQKELNKSLLERLLGDCSSFCSIYSDFYLQQNMLKVNAKKYTFYQKNNQISDSLPRIDLKAGGL